jgi:tripartite-type tricarboxylate transporter receptor subunit TctC
MLLSSPADGYTLIFSDAAMVTVTPLLLKNLPYNPREELLPVSYTARAPNFIAVNPSVPAKDWPEFVALAKQSPGKITCGSSGVGSVHHLTLEFIKSAVNVDLVHVPFKGSGQSTPALLGGQIDCLLASLAPLTGPAAQGRVRILAYVGSDPSPIAPNIPPIGGDLKGFNSAFILGVLAKKGTPPDVVKRISDEIAAALKMPDVVDALGKIGVEPVGGGPDAYHEALRKDAEEMAVAAKAAKLKAE